MTRAIRIVQEVFVRSRVAALGAVIVTTGFVLEAGLLVRAVRHEDASIYFGMVIWALMPAFILAGLALIPLGLFLVGREAGGGRFSLGAFDELISVPTAGALSKVLAVVMGLTVINVIFFSTVSYEAYHYMDSSEFCGQVCHQVMAPEHAVYQRSPHGGVECVKCHIGPGAGFFVKSKMSGAWQMVAVLADIYPRPIPTPVHNLRPARDTCEQCHDPQTFQGSKIKVVKIYTEDEDNTLRYTILNVRIGGGEEIGHPSEGVHWHISDTQTVTYETTDEAWEDVVRVRLDDTEDGSSKVWTRIDAPTDGLPTVERVMDCVDCHNRTAHHFLGAEEALDQAMALERVDAAIPWIKREGLAVLTEDYADEEEAAAAIRGLAGRYQADRPAAWAEHQEAIEAAIEVLLEIWNLYVHPEMNITWNTYPSRRTHTGTRGGCYRCHNDDVVDEEGTPLNSECEVCHYILAEDEVDPMVFQCLHMERSVDLF